MNELTSEYDKMYDDLYDYEDKGTTNEEPIVSDICRREKEKENNSPEIIPTTLMEKQGIVVGSLNKPTLFEATINTKEEEESKEEKEWKNEELIPLLIHEQDVRMEETQKKNDENKNSNEINATDPTQQSECNNDNNIEMKNEQTEENKLEQPTEQAHTVENKEGNNANKNENNSKDNEPRSTFECNICFDDVRDPVVTKCGHLFCWLCLSSWIKKNKDCPVCKAEVSKENVIPLYGRGRSSNDHKYKTADDEPRPTPKRKESVRRNANGNNLGLRASFGVWVNPFSFGLSYTNMSEEPYFTGENRGERRVQTETFHAEAASSFFFFLGFFLSLYILFYSS